VLLVTPCILNDLRTNDVIDGDDDGSGTPYNGFRALSLSLIVPDVEWITVINSSFSHLVGH